MSPRGTTEEAVEGGGRLGRLRIFLNYRREDSSGHAGRLYDDLAERFGAGEVFMDIDKIEPGLPFDDVIEHALDRCDVVLALIGRQWLTIADASGHSRLEDPDDFCRLELEEALARGTRLIPLRVQGAEMPGSAELPESLRGLARRQGMELSDTRWRHDVESLINVLERLTTEKAERELDEHERLAQEQAERERQERERLEQVRTEQERVAWEQAEQERLARERAEEERRTQEETERKRRAAQEKAEREHRAQERVEKERRAAQEKAERERLAKTKRQADADAAVTQVGVRGLARRPVALVAAGIIVVALGAVIAYALSSGNEGNRAPTEPVAVPASKSPPTISGTMRAGNTLTAQRGSWRGAPIKFAYQWRRCDEGGAGCVTVGGAASPTYRLTARDVGRRMRVSITASNAGGSRTSISKATSVVAPASVPPASSEPPTVSGTAQQGSSLVVRAGTWKGTKPISYTYEWRRCNSDGAACVAISGARGTTTYTLRSQDVGHTIRVVERASNVGGRSAATSKPTSVVRAEPTSSGPSTTPPALTTPPPSTGPIETVPPALPP